MTVPKFKTTKKNATLGYNESSKRWLPLTVNASGSLIVDASGVTDATTETTYNVTLTVADTEYSQALPANTLGYTFQNRNYNKLRWSYVTGKVAGSTSPYNEIKPGASISEGDIDLTGKTLYLASSTAGDVVEIITWT